VTLEFLSPHGAADGVVARSPMERQAAAAGARFELRDGWNIAVAYGSPDQEAQAGGPAAAWADVSHLGKLELQGNGVCERAGLELGRASRRGDGWWCPLTPDRALVICDASELAAAREQVPEDASAVDVTTVFAALTLVGPLSREVFARFCAIDLRSQVTPVGGLRPGSIARQPGVILREAPERYLFLFGWAIGQYMWTVVADAARHLGGRPLGMDALASLEPTLTETTARA
jgi:heterotetrameric sarcosine oxidase gamma subunit